MREHVCRRGSRFSRPFYALPSPVPPSAAVEIHARSRRITKNAMTEKKLTVSLQFAEGNGRCERRIYRRRLEPPYHELNGRFAITSQRRFPFYFRVTSTYDMYTRNSDSREENHPITVVTKDNSSKSVRASTKDLPRRSIFVNIRATR